MCLLIFRQRTRGFNEAEWIVCTGFAGAYSVIMSNMLPLLCGPF